MLQLHHERAHNYYDTIAERLLTWPDVQMEAIQQARQTLADAMSDNFGRATKALIDLH